VAATAADVTQVPDVCSITRAAARYPLLNPVDLAAPFNGQQTM
jgi:hypothetical protein